MRVISGRYRGRRLKGPKGATLRPTGDRLKETLFNILSPRIHGAVVFDIFSGTGAIGIEALSRGAGRAVFVDRDPAAGSLMRQNLELCAAEDEFLIIQEDVFTTLRSLARQGVRADIIFFDPPYDWKHYPDLLKLAFNPGIASAGTCVVIEHGRKAVLPESGDGYSRYRVVRQGDNCLSFYKKTV
jgi:16S rRNA (guanine(966)-N(2))-methyltransferase RsmD